MILRLGIIFSLFAAVPSMGGCAVRAAALDLLTVDELERRLKVIDAELSRIAGYSHGLGIGPIGYRSQTASTESHTEWVEVNLGEAIAIDEVVLVPALRRAATGEVQADAFPLALRVLAGVGADRKVKPLAEFSPRDELLPRVAPLAISCGGIKASWIRIEATTLSQRAFDGNFVFALAEVLAFSGRENVALRKPVRSSSGDQPSLAPGWAEAYLTDGILPYVMASGDGRCSVAYVNQFDLGESPAITIDLGAVQRVNRLHLHAVDQSNTVPQAFAGDIGIPQLLRVEGARAADFSDAMPLVELRRETIYDVGPILMRSFPPVDCRYVRLLPIERTPNPLYGPIAERVGFAEVEVFADGRNVALHRPVSATFNAESGLRQLANLTDGMNFYGTILPVRAWLNQLAERHALDRERPQIVAELGRRYSRQRSDLVQLGWLAAALGCGIVGLVVASRIQRRRAIDQTRTRIAADLHDELGADLHAVGLLTDLAQAETSDPTKLADLLRRIRSLTERAGQAARHCTNMLEARGLFGDPANDLRRAAERILADLEHTIELEGAEVLRSFSAQRRIDLQLFYQECLINIIRHSGATRAQTRLWSEDGNIHLTITDDGSGLDGPAPASLKRRARLLGATLESGRAEPHGLRIRLRMKIREPRFFG